MLGTGLKNPLYGLFGGADTIAYLLASIALVAAPTLFWKGFKKAGVWAVGGSFAMLVVAFNDTATWKADSYWIQPDILDDAKFLVQPAPSDVAVLIALGWLAYQSVTAKKLLQSGGAIVALIGGAVVATDMIALAFGFGSRASDNVFVVNDHLWGVLLVASIVYAAMATVTLIVRGIQRIKHRAELDMVTGAATTSHPQGR